MLGNFLDTGLKRKIRKDPRLSGAELQKSVMKNFVENVHRTEKHKLEEHGKGAPPSRGRRKSGHFPGGGDG